MQLLAGERVGLAAHRASTAATRARAPANRRCGSSLPAARLRVELDVAGEVGLEDLAGRQQQEVDVVRRVVDRVGGRRDLGQARAVELDEVRRRVEQTRARRDENVAVRQQRRGTVGLIELALARDRRIVRARAPRLLTEVVDRGVARSRPTGTPCRRDGSVAGPTSHESRSAISTLVAPPLAQPPAWCASGGV